MYEFDVPASAAEVRGFIDRYRTKFEKQLHELKDLLDRLKRTERALRSAYKIYSRADMQLDDELKGARKVRLKFNKWNLERGNKRASLFDVPDIVGLRIVVTYPSDISAVAAVLDAAIDRGDLIHVYMGKGDEGTGIETKYGRPMDSDGYYACHYNVRVPSVGDAQPVIEIQLKTVLHDAWGLKTHDLTYKPSGRIAGDLITSFNLLGESLGNLDKQSDTMRQSIVKSSAVREAKRRRIQTWILSSICAGNIAEVANPTLRRELEGLKADIEGMSEDTLDSDVRPKLIRLMKIFGTQPTAASRLICYMAAMLQRTAYFEQAQETITAREEKAATTLDIAKIRSEGALAAFAFGDVGQAIDMAEEAELIVQKMIPADAAEEARVNRMMLALYSDLGYYYADIIGSDDGDKRNASKRAVDYLRAVVSVYPANGVPSQGIKASDEEIKAALTQPNVAEEVFYALDNEAYIAIQTAQTVEDVRAACKRLDFLHQMVPSKIEKSAELAGDYHDYCARVRLAELEEALLV